MTTTTTNEVSVADIGHDVVTLNLWDTEVFQILEDLITIEENYDTPIMGRLHGLKALRKEIRRIMHDQISSDPHQDDMREEELRRERFDVEFSFVDEGPF